MQLTLNFQLICIDYILFFIFLQVICRDLVLFDCCAKINNLSKWQIEKQLLFEQNSRYKSLLRSNIPSEQNMCLTYHMHSPGEINYILAKIKLKHEKEEWRRLKYIFSSAKQSCRSKANKKVLISPIENLAKLKKKKSQKWSLWQAQNICNHCAGARLCYCQKKIKQNITEKAKIKAYNKKNTKIDMVKWK